jgi:hypothetical protein
MLPKEFGVRLLVYNLRCRIQNNLGTSRHHFTRLLDQGTHWSTRKLCNYKITKQLTLRSLFRGPDCLLIILTSSSLVLLLLLILPRRQLWCRPTKADR